MFGKQRGRKVAENAMGKESWEMISLRLKMIIALALISALMFGFGKMCLAEGKSTEVPRMTKEELQAMLGSPDVVILDVRVEDE
jgi:flagellar biogenesis protein FliO